MTRFAAAAITVWLLYALPALAQGPTPIPTPVPPPDPYTMPTPDRRPPPNATSDVRVVLTPDGGWLVVWRDNSADETNFEVLVRAEDWTGFFHDVLHVRDVPANATSVRLPRDAPAELRRDGNCYLAHVWVFAARNGSAWGLPGNTTSRLCVDAGRISFPSAGAAPAETGDRLLAWVVSWILLSCGGALMVFAQRVRGSRGHGT